MKSGPVPIRIMARHLIRTKPSVDCERTKPNASKTGSTEGITAAYQAMLGLEMFVRKQSRLEPALLQLVKICTPQI